MLRPSKTRGNGAIEVKDVLEEGLAGIAVPAVRDGQLNAMLAIYLPTARFNKEFEGKALGALKWGVQELV